MGYIKKSLRKRIITTVLFGISFLALFGMYACSTASDINISKLNKWMGCNDKIKVLTTTPIIEDLVSRIGGENIEIISLIEGDLDPHSYEIVRGDAEKIATAQVIFANGLSLEHSASISHQLKMHKNVVFLGDEVMKSHPKEIIYIQGQVDPHIWMDLTIWKKCINPIAENLTKLDPLHAEDFQKNAQIALYAFDNQHNIIKRKLAQIPIEKRYLVTSHDAFNYFVRCYFVDDFQRERATWNNHVVAIQGLAPDEQISPLEISSVVKYVLTHKIPVIFSERNLSQDSLHKVVDACRRKGMNTILANDVLFGDTMGGNTYFEMLDHNVEVICRNLGTDNEKTN